MPASAQTAMSRQRTAIFTPLPRRAPLTMLPQPLPVRVPLLAKVLSMSHVALRDTFCADATLRRHEFGKEQRQTPREASKRCAPCVLLQPARLPIIRPQRMSDASHATLSEIRPSQHRLLSRCRDVATILLRICQVKRIWQIIHRA